MPADVSQFIQMQRLLALENRRPLPREKTITHFQIPCYSLPTVTRPGLSDTDVFQELI
jgi:hypothetical protein